MAVEINLTDQGFPKDAPALSLWERAYGTKDAFKSAFATSLVMGPNGKWPFGSSGSGYLADFGNAINYHPDMFAKYLDESLARWKRAVAIASDEALDEAARKAKLDALYSEILRSIKSANTPGERK